MFLLSDMMLKLQPKILEMSPGTRVVSNSFSTDDWPPDETAKLGDCKGWCTAHLWIVPAKVEGTWRLPQGELTLKQNFQDLSGTLTSTGRVVPILFGQMRGDQITFSAGDAKYTGRIIDDAMQGMVTRGNSTESWSATKRR